MLVVMVVQVILLIVVIVVMDAVMDEAGGSLCLVMLGQRLGVF